MRPLLISHLYPPDGITGVERYTKSLASGLVELGDSVSIFSRAPSRKDEELLVERLPDGAQIYRLGGHIPVERFLADHNRVERLFTRVLIEARPDVVHCNHLLLHAPRCLELARRHGAAVVVSLHDFYFACTRQILRKLTGEVCSGPDGGLECARTCFSDEPTESSPRWSIRTTYFRALLRLAARIICPSRYVADFFVRFGVPPDRLRVIPNGVWVPGEPGHPAAMDAPPTADLRLTYLGAVVNHKGLHILLEALAMARLPKVRLIVAGPTPNAAYLSQLRGLAGSIPGLEVRWQGPYDPAALAGVLSGETCVVVPSQCPETFSFVVREAFAHGVPVAVARIGALPEVVRDGENGLSFTHDRPEELAGLLRRLLVDGALVERLRRGARKTPLLSVTAHAAAVRDVYGQAIQETGGLGPLAPGDQAEIAALENILLTMGFGKSA